MLTSNINKFNKPRFRDKEQKNLSSQKRSHFLNNNPILVARYFQHILEVFLKEIILKRDHTLGKAKYAICIEFQERR